MLLFNAGARDLISVLPPDAPLSPSSKIPSSARGKSPGRRLPNGTWVGFAGWQKHRTAAADVGCWISDRANIGLLTRNWPTVDCDIENESHARELQELLRPWLGDAPVRVGRPPKWAVVCRTDAPFGKRKISLT